MREKFTPPEETITLSGHEIQRIAEYLSFLYDKQRYDADRQTGTTLLNTACEISIKDARQIGCDDLVMRLQRNALALCNLQDMIVSCIESMQSEIRSIIEAQNGEHEQYLERTNQLRQTWLLQRQAERKKVYRQKTK